jgi:hypothetical protein
MITRHRLLAALLIALPLSGPAVAQQNSSTDGATSIENDSGQTQPDSNPADPSPADPNQTDQPKVDTHQTPDFAAFWQRFTTALRKNDTRQLQLMTELPFDFDGQHFDAAHFAALAKGLYDDKSRRCLASETPVFDQGIYEVFCGEMIYVFTPIPGFTPEQAAKILDGSAWRLSEIGAND